MKHKTKILFILIACLFSLISVQKAQAAGEVTASPVIIDEKGYPRDFIDKTIVLTNNTNRKLNVYAFVQDIEPADGAKDYEKVYGGEVAESLANWVEIQRSAIELAPRETKHVPLKLQVNFRAKPGNYHAQIGFAHGSSVPAAESAGYDAVTILNVEVLDDANEFLQVGSFTSDKTFFTGFPVGFNYELENTGNRDLSPEGELIIYDRRGREVSSVKMPANSLAISAEESSTFAVEWTSGQSAGSSSALATMSSGLSNMGRYKAVLRLKYGSGQPQSVQDTVFFWVVPWHLILGAFMTLGGVVVFFVSRLHKKTYGEISND